MNSVRWRAEATLSWRCCRETGAATRALTRPRHSIPMRSCRSGAILTRAALRIWRRALLFSPPRLAGRLGAPPPVPVSAFGRFDAACFEAGPGAARALIVFYRSIYLANDLEPIEALARALQRQGLRGHERLRDQSQGRGGALAACAPSSPGSASTSCSTPPPFPRVWT